MVFPGSRVIPTTGAWNCIDALSANAGKRFVQGLDVTAGYELPGPEQLGQVYVLGRLEPLLHLEGGAGP